MGRVPVGDFSLNHSSRCIRLALFLAATTTVAACADSRMAANNAAPNQPEQPYKTGFGFSSDGPTTDLYTEFFGSSRRDVPAAQPATASAAPPAQLQPAPGSPVPQQNQRTAAYPANRQANPGQPNQPAVASVAPEPPLQPAPPPAPPPAPDTPAAYGITSNGPTTDLFTELFGPRRRDSQ